MKYAKNGLVTILNKTGGGPVLAKVLARRYGGRGRDWRRMANDSQGRVLGTLGGYVLTRKVSGVGILKWKHSILSQVNEMRKRVGQVESLLLARFKRMAAKNVQGRRSGKKTNNKRKTSPK